MSRLRFQIGEVCVFMVAVDVSMAVLQGVPCMIVLRDIRKGDHVGEDAFGRKLFTDADYDYVIEFAGGQQRAVAADFQLGPVRRRPDPPALTRQTEPA